MSEGLVDRSFFNGMSVDAFSFSRCDASRAQSAAQAGVGGGRRAREANKKGKAGITALNSLLYPLLLALNTKPYDLFFALDSRGVHEIVFSAVFAVVERKAAAVVRRKHRRLLCSSLSHKQS